MKCLDFLCKVIQNIYVSDGKPRYSPSSNATVESTYTNNVCIVTDPPYYDNIAHADLFGFLLHLATTKFGSDLSQSI